MTIKPLPVMDVNDINVSVINLSDVIDTTALQEMLNDYYSLTGIGVGIIDLKGNVLVGAGWQDICVKFHRAVNESCVNCNESDIFLSSGITPGTFKAYRCKNNLWDIATPIMLGDTHIGNIFLGQFLYDDEEPNFELFRAQAKRFGYDETAYLNALNSVSRYSRQTVKTAMSFYTKLAQMISAANYSNVILADNLIKRQRAEAALQKQVLALTKPIDDSDGIRFSDLFNIDELQHIQDAFADAMGVASLITTPEGVPITKPSNFCRLCSDIIRKSEKGLANCMRSDKELGKFNPSGPTVQPCMSGGLWDGGTSISVGGRHIANWLIGQVRNEELDDEQLLAYADEIGVDREKFRNALSEVTVMSKERFNKTTRALYLLANEMSLKAYQNIQQARFITEHKRYEQELIDKNTELERFNYTVSHDLKSPVITIKGFAGSLENDLAHGKYDRMAVDLKRISNAADKMGNLLNDLLLLSRVGKTMHTPTMLDMNRLVGEVLAQLAGSINLGDIRIDVQPDLPEAEGDYHRIFEVVQNLIENAIKYRTADVPLRVEIGATRDAFYTTYFVRDNGMGIDSRHYETIFGLFNKLDMKSEGTGVGLALVKRIVDLHDGKIRVASDGIGKGSCFKFSLPVR